tara:strand:- start:4676 stop:5326 length:651 start_codon:yes stop_codon:yes gene_type:complete
MQHLGNDYLKTIGRAGLVKLSNESKKYLDEMHYRITSNNELVFPKSHKPNFYIIDQKAPFHFSLPGGHYFLSQGLLKKYLANEDLLAAVMAIEIFRSEKNIYEKKVIIPIGNYETQKMLSVVRLPVNTRGEINKWAYLLMKRSSYDPGALLNLIQLKNKNAIDFAATVGNISTISREEFNYKNFLSRTPTENNIAVLEKNSARGFYSLRNDIMRDN